MKKQKKNRFLLNILLIVAIGVMVFSGVMLVKELRPELDTQKEQKQLLKMVEKEEDQEVKLEPDWDELEKTNADVIAWIYVEGTDISYPIVRGADNSYYLTHSFYGEDNPYGTIFLDYQTALDFSDFNSILYGHSISGTLKDMVFSEVHKFEDQDFFQSHKTLYILTPEQNYRGDIIAYTKTMDTSGLYQHLKMNDEQRTTYLQTLKQEALYYRESVWPESNDSHLVMLSTCDTDYGIGSDYRLLLHANLTKWDEDIIVQD